MGNKGGVYLGAGYGILASIFRLFVWITWKTDIVEAFDVSLRCQFQDLKGPYHIDKIFDIGNKYPSWTLYSR